MVHEALVLVVGHDRFFSWSFSRYIWMKAGSVLKCTNDLNLKQQFWKVYEKCMGGSKLITMFSAFKYDLLNSEVLFLLCALRSLFSSSLLCINGSPWERSLCSVLIPQLWTLSNLAVVLPGPRQAHALPQGNAWNSSSLTGVRFQREISNLCFVGRCSCGESIADI